MTREDHRNNSHNWNPEEVKPKNRSSFHISEFPTSPQQAFSLPVCLHPDISSIMKQSKAENSPEVDVLLYLIMVCWITMKQNGTNLKVRASKNRRDFPRLRNTCSHKVKNEFTFLKHFFYFLKVIVRRCIPKFDRKVIVIPGLHMQKHLKQCFGNRGKESPLWDSGETEARICIQFGDLIMRNRRDILQEVQRKSTGIIKEPQYLL